MLDHACVEYIHPASHTLRDCNLPSVFRAHVCAYASDDIYDYLHTRARTHSPLCPRRVSYVHRYVQKKTVAERPNPPKEGRWWVANNRSVAQGGYADYRIGLCYLSVDDVALLSRSNGVDHGVETDENTSAAAAVLVSKHESSPPQLAPPAPAVPPAAAATCGGGSGRNGGGGARYALSVMPLGGVEEVQRRRESLRRQLQQGQ